MDRDLTDAKKEYYYGDKKPEAPEPEAPKTEAPKTEAPEPEIEYTPEEYD